MIQLASLVGAALLLLAYAAHQAGRLGRESLAYHLLNAVGALVLCAVAIETVQIGFIVLEAVWTAISLAAVVRVARGPTQGT